MKKITDLSDFASSHSPSDNDFERKLDNVKSAMEKTFSSMQDVYAIYY